MRYVVLVAALVVAILGVVLLVGRRSGTSLTGGWKTLAASQQIHGSRLSGIWFFDKNNGIIVSSGFIATTGDSGKQWTIVHSSEQNGYYSFAFADTKNGIAVGSVDNKIPFVLRTKDAGRSWQTLNFDPKLINTPDVKITTFLDACFDSTGKIWIAGNRGIVSGIVEANNLNVTSVSPATEVLYSVACAADGTIWAAGQNTVLSNRNSWQRKPLDQKYYFGKVKSLGNDIWLCGGTNDKPPSEHGSGVLLRSNDSGATWENKTPKSAGLVYDLVKTDDLLWLAGAGGQIHYSKDNGDSWTVYPSPTDADLLSIYFLDGRTGWIAGAGGAVLTYSR